ncbi:MAG: hypothetical protein RLZZ458_761, partial [Planctomycetota bacterium]
SINLIGSTTTLTGATLSTLSATNAVTLGTGAGIASTSGASVAVSAGAGGVTQAANASIVTNNTTAAITISVTGGGTARIGTLTASDGSSGVGTVSVTVTGGGSVLDNNDASTSVNNVTAATFTVSATGGNVGSPTNPIEYNASPIDVTGLTNTWLVYTGTSGGGGFSKRYDFSSRASGVLGGTVGVLPNMIYSASALNSVGFASGQSIAIMAARATSKQTYLFYHDALVQTSRVATFYVKDDTLSASTSYNVRVYFGSASYATNTIITEPGSLTPIAGTSAVSCAINQFTAVQFTRSTDGNKTISFEFKRPAAVTSGYWGVVGIDISAGTLPTELPQMLADVSFDEHGMTPETVSRLESSGLQGRILNEELLLNARAEAIAAWAASGITPEQRAILENTPLIINDLADSGQLGLALKDHVVLDDDAMGLGWFVGDSSESVPEGMVDLVTVVTHELGHRLGLVDLDVEQHPGDIMAGTIQPGERRFVRRAIPVSVPASEPTIQPADQAAVTLRNTLFETQPTLNLQIVKGNAETTLSQAPVTARDTVNRKVADLFNLEKPNAEIVASGSIESVNLSVLDDLFADAVGVLDALND